jgi:D-arabinose 5-phosphate isomerase GutQ
LKPIFFDGRSSGKIGKNCPLDPRMRRGENDVLPALSTSGNSKNIIHAIRIARAKNMKIIGLTGRTGGTVGDLCTACIRVPEDETFKIQELHLPIYHALCQAVETHFLTGAATGNW